MSSDALEFEAVEKAFKDGSPVLNGLSASVPTRGITFVVGASGSGKSVLCRLAVGLLRPDQGEVRLWGEPVHSLPERALARLRRKAPYIVQGPALLDWLTVQENVALAAPHKSAAVAHRALSRIGLEELSSAMPAQLGPATKKRVSIARALALEPEFLLLDEPTTGLDRAAARQVNEAILALARQGLGALVVSHDYGALQAIADRVLWLDHGKAGFFGRVPDFLASADPKVRALLAPGLEEVRFHG
jgi:phospholipid/cholesterol/gamma-HCH transport system ATP-binding protein